MAKVTLSRENANKPSPKFWRRFENAYFTALAPAIGGLIMGWGFTDDYTNKLTLLLVVLGAIIKAVGIMLANGEIYEKATSRESDENGGGAVIPNRGF